MERRIETVQKLLMDIAENKAEDEHIAIIVKPEMLEMLNPVLIKPKPNTLQHYYYKLYKIWIRTTEQDSYFQLAGAEFTQIYFIDVPIDAPAVRYVRTRLRCTRTNPIDYMSVHFIHTRGVPKPKLFEEGL